MEVVPIAKYYMFYRVRAPCFRGLFYFRCKAAEKEEHRINF